MIDECVCALFLNTGRNQDAEKYYRRGVRLRPHDATSHMNLGAMLHFNGKWDEAEKSYLRALELRPNDRVTEENLEKVRNLMKAARDAANRTEEPEEPEKDKKKKKKKKKDKEKDKK